MDEPMYYDFDYGCDTPEQLEQANHEYWTAVQDQLETEGPIFRRYVDDEIPY